MAGDLLATYGTLRRALNPSARPGGTALSFVSSCAFDGLLYDLGRFPGAVEGDGTVHGDLCRVQTASAWTALDRYEGFSPEDESSSLFVRRRVDLREPSDTTAWVYWYNGPTRGHSPVASGDWVAYVREHRPQLLTPS